MAVNTINTESTSTSTGTMVLAGRFGMSGRLWSSAVSTSTISTSTISTVDITVTGGASFSNNINVDSGRIINQYHEGVSVGYSVLDNVTTGVGNVGVGRDCLRSISTGYYNTGVGHTVLTLNSSGSCNTAIGYKAGYGAGSQSYNTYLGYNTMCNGISSAYNYSTAIGANALITASNQIDIR